MLPKDSDQEHYNTRLITCLCMGVKNQEPKKNFGTVEKWCQNQMGLNTFTHVKKLKEVQSFMDGQKMHQTLNFPMELDSGEKNMKLRQNSSS